MDALKSKHDVILLSFSGGCETRHLHRNHRNCWANIPAARRYHISYKDKRNSSKQREAVLIVRDIRRVVKSVKPICCSTE